MSSIRKKIILIITTVFISIPFFVLPEPVLAVGIGEALDFNISSKFDFSGRTNVRATLHFVGQKAQYFFEDNYWNSRSSLEQNEILSKATRLADEFDNRIYPQEINLWGAEPNPGIDDDSKVYIIFTNLVDTAGGYFDTSNLYSKSRVPESNEKEVIFLNIRLLSSASDRRVFSFLAHEFQHLISFNQKTLLRNSDDDIWLNEARSEFSPSYLGYDETYDGSNLKRRVVAFLEEPTDSLTEWSNESKDYGQVGLFGAYLTERFGSGVLAESLQSIQSGIESLNTVFARNGSGFDFGDIFLRWAVANTINDSTLNPFFGYLNAGLRQDVRVSPTQIISGVNDTSELLVSHDFKDWQAKWIWINNLPVGYNNFLQINFSGPKKSFFEVASIIFYQNGTKDIRFFNLADPASGTDIFFDLTNGVEKIILIPVKMEKVSNFTAQEELSSLHMNMKRVAVPLPILTEVASKPQEVPLTISGSSTSEKAISGSGRPSDFGLKEGDFIRAEGDNDIYIINDFGYKRLVLSPKICLQYGHLGARGCFGAVRVVSSFVRDAFKTSWYFTNGETGDGKVYFLEQTGEDEAILHHLNISGNDFANQGGDFKSVFIFNSREQNSYFVGGTLVKLPD